MAAYLYGEIHVTDAAGYEAYRLQVPAVLAAYGGRYLVRGGETSLLEGADPAGRQVILAFDDMAGLRAFYDSAEYAPLKAIRQRCSTGRLLAISGV